MDLVQLHAMERVLNDVWEERARQHAQWGEQNLPDGTCPARASRARRGAAKRACDKAAAQGKVTFAHVLAEEFFEVLCETDPVALRNELLQVAAVACQWVEAIDRRRGK
jgi:hypothetical protein